MAGLIGEGVSLRGFHVEDFSWTWNLTGTIARADVGKLMTQDTAAKNSAKLAGDDAAPLGVLMSYENRTVEGTVVGAIELKGSFEIATTGVVAIGDSICGSATPGVAKKALAANNTLVVEVGTGTAVVIFK